MTRNKPFRVAPRIQAAASLAEPGGREPACTQLLINVYEVPSAAVGSQWRLLPFEPSSGLIELAVKTDVNREIRRQ